MSFKLNKLDDLRYMLCTFKEKSSTRGETDSILNDCKRLRGDIESLMHSFATDFKIFVQNQKQRNETAEIYKNTLARETRRLEEIEADIKIKLETNFTILDP